MADHNRFTLDTPIQVYFCDPYHPRKRGSNENTNGLLRQYFSKGLNLSTYSQENLDEVARLLNERPRKTLNYETPAQRFNQCVASTGGMRSQTGRTKGENMVLCGALLKGSVARYAIQMQDLRRLRHGSTEWADTGPRCSVGTLEFSNSK